MKTSNNTTNHQQASRHLRQLQKASKQQPTQSTFRKARTRLKQTSSRLQSTPMKIVPENMYCNSSYIRDEVEGAENNDSSFLRKTYYLLPNYPASLTIITTNLILNISYLMITLKISMIVFLITRTNILS